MRAFKGKSCLPHPLLLVLAPYCTPLPGARNCQHQGKKQACVTELARCADTAKSTAESSGVLGLPQDKVGELFTVADAWPSVSHFKNKTSNKPSH